MSDEKNFSNEKNISEKNFANEEKNANERNISEKQIVKLEDCEGYAKNYSEDNFWKKLKDHAVSMGGTLIYKALQLYYVAQSETCPLKIKAGIFAALGYLISPIDLIPDFIPVTGYTDDAGAIALALVLAQMYITDEIKLQAQNKIKTVFGEKFLNEILA